MKKLSLACALLALCCLLPALACAALPEYEYTQELTYGSFTLRVPHSFVLIEGEGYAAGDEYMDPESDVQMHISYYPSYFEYKNTGELVGHCLELANEWYPDSKSYEFVRADECLATVISEYGFIDVDIYNRGELLSLIIARMTSSWDPDAVEEARQFAHVLLEHISAPEKPLE